MTSTSTNSMHKNSSYTCIPLSKMPISLAQGIIRSSVLLIFLTASFLSNIVLALMLQQKTQMLQVTNCFFFNLLVTDLLQVSLLAP